MRAPCCQQRIEVQTDPRNAEYVVVSGARRKVETGGDDDGRVEVDPQALGRPTDALGRLEVAEEDKQRASSEFTVLNELREQSGDRFRDDAANNRLLRKAMRSARKEEQARDGRRQQLGLPESVTLQPETALDRLRAAAVDYGGGAKQRMVGWKNDRRKIANSSIFSPQAVAATRKRNSSSVQQRGPGRPLAPAGGVQKARRREVGARLRLTEPGN